MNKVWIWYGAYYYEYYNKSIESIFLLKDDDMREENKRE